MTQPTADEIDALVEKVNAIYRAQEREAAAAIRATELDRRAERINASYRAALDAKRSAEK